VTSLAAPAVNNFIVNDGNPQRSMVDSLTVVFNEPVTLASGALLLEQLPTAGGAAIAQSFTLSNPSGDRETYVLTVNSASGSLPNGVYNVVVNGGDVQNAVGATMTAGQSFGFYCFYGDFYGTGVVNFADFALVLAHFQQPAALGSPYWYLDDTGSGVIGFSDFAGVLKEFQQSMGPSAALGAIPTATAGSPLTITANASPSALASLDDTLSYQWTVTDNGVAVAAAQWRRDERGEPDVHSIGRGRVDGRVDGYRHDGRALDGPRRAAVHGQRWCVRRCGHGRLAGRESGRGFNDGCDIRDTGRWAGHAAKSAAVRLRRRAGIFQPAGHSELAAERRRRAGKHRRCVAAGLAREFISPRRARRSQSKEMGFEFLASFASLR